MHCDFRFTLFSLVSAFLILPFANAFYIPGWSIRSYRDGQAIPLFVNKVYSDNSQLQFAYSELPFVCPPSGRKHGASNLISGSSLALNLGQVLRGDRITLSDYELNMGNDDEAHYLCSRKIDWAGLKRAQELVADGFVAEWIVDNLPGATSFVTVDRSRKYYAAGFKLGYEDLSPTTGLPIYYINNHFTIVIRYHRAPGRAGNNGKKTIVGFEVYAKSLEAEGRNETGLPGDIQAVENGLQLQIGGNTTSTDKRDNSLYPNNDEVDDFDENATLTIPYTYSVYFREEEKVEWQNRWDLYFVDQEDSSKIHWLAIVNSLIISGLLTSLVAVIIARTIYGDIKNVKEKSLEEGKIKLKRRTPKSPKRKSTDKGGLLDQPDAIKDAGDSSDEEAAEDLTGWKLLHGDVFRTPPFPGILAPLIGSGMQLVFMATGLLLLSCFGVLNPSFRGGYISVGVALFIFAGLFSGYFSGRAYKTFGGQLWKKNVIVTATLFPGLLFATVFILNFFVWAQASSTAIPFGTLIALLSLWLLVQLPLVYAGSWFGFIRAGGWDHPIKTNPIPRQVPPQQWYFRSWRLVLLAGLIPFSVIFIELMFVFKSLWQDKSGYYYVFGFFAVVSVILILTVVEVTIVVTYNQLCAENYHWWWQSFLVGGSSSIWVFAYCLYYYYAKLHIQGVISGLLFFSYSFLACTVYGLLTGTVGFLSAYAFVRRIYR
ncbi:endomembrane protein 70 [Viridothelium virens]|uniref:Transmembrane 9 superfamily member n=1 Tax=Viridothelium virens TaxID=1048519 RepID=A0A6A6HBP6_VIRVR|nr:endomembrane protein 70 [Viridothelium virens]